VNLRKNRITFAYVESKWGVFDVDLGHTDPQLVIPYGGMVRVDGPARRITVWVNGAET